MRPSVFAEPAADWSAASSAQVAPTSDNSGKRTALSGFWQSLNDSVNAYLQRDRAYRELTLLDDRLLADIGLHRSEIGRAVLGHGKVRF